jgi:hypothetical protein
MATQADMLANQWPQAEESTIFGFSSSDWYKDAKDLLQTGWAMNNADKLTQAGPQQNDLMNSVGYQTQPNAQYIDPKQAGALNALQSNGINPMYAVAGVVGAALLYMLVTK